MMQMQVRGQYILKIAGNVLGCNCWKEKQTTQAVESAAGTCKAGFKGFKQDAVSIIIAETDSRKQQAH